MAGRLLSTTTNTWRREFDMKHNTVYHANWTGGKVCETFFSYEDFANRWSEISYMQIPDCRYSAWSQFNSTNHVRTCLDCGKKEYRAHYAQTTGYGTCLACGYVGNIYVGIQTVPTEKQWNICQSERKHLLPFVCWRSFRGFCACWRRAAQKNGIQIKERRTMAPGRRPP